MIFAKPNYLFLLFLLPLIGFLVLLANHSQTKALKKLGESKLIGKLTESINWRGRKWRTLLWFLSVFLLIISLARAIALSPWRPVLKRIANKAASLKASGPFSRSISRGRSSSGQSFI